MAKYYLGFTRRRRGGSEGLTGPLAASGVPGHPARLQLRGARVRLAGRTAFQQTPLVTVSEVRALDRGTRGSVTRRLRTVEGKPLRPGLWGRPPPTASVAPEAETRGQTVKPGAEAANRRADTSSDSLRQHSKLHSCKLRRKMEPSAPGTLPGTQGHKQDGCPLGSSLSWRLIN